MFFFYACTSIGLIAPMAFLPTFMTRLGVTSSQLGILMALRPAAMIVGQFIWGQVADRSKTINKILFLLISGSVGAGVIFLLAKNFYELAAATILYYFFYSAICPLMDTIALDMVDKGLIPSYGNIRIMITLGYVISSSITGILCQKNPYYMFFMIIGFGLLAIVTLLMVEKTPGRRQKGVKFKSFQFFWKGAILLPLGLYLILQFVYAAADVIFPVYLSINLGAGDSMYGYSMALRVLGEFLILPFIGRISKRISFRNAISIFMLFSALRFFICIFTVNPVALVLVSILSGIGNIGAFSWIMMYINNQSPPEGKATVQSQMWMMFSIAQVIGNLCTGYFMPDSTIGVTTSFFIFPTIVMTSLAVIYRIFGPKDKHSDVQI